MLNLRDNLLNDKEAYLLAKSLTKNTTLQILRLTGNQIARIGVKALFRAIFNTRSFDDVYDSNHRCWVDVEDEHLPVYNTYVEPKLNRDMKLLCVLTCFYKNNADPLNLAGVPIKVMPRVLAFIQQIVAEQYRLNATFTFIREWRMPLLYTSKIGLDLRRSDRIRKKRVMELMATAK